MNHESYIRRCFDLARLGAGSTSPNPMVGAVLVHENRIIGEGWHQKVGQAHAEVNAVGSVKPADRHLISQSTLYVSLEPCCIYGRTPPCTGLILENKIPKVVISAIDQSPAVKGQGLDILRSAGVEVVTGVLEKEGEALASIRNTYVSKKRPHITLKFARSKDGFMGQAGRQVWISGPFSNRLSHRLRHELDAILVGTTTALTDDPQLTNRLWFGRSPLRILLDRELKVSLSQKIFSDNAQTLVVTEKPAPEGPANVEFFQAKFDETLLPKLLSHLFERNISSLLVEGGAVTLGKFIEQGLWDEAIVFTGKYYLSSGIPAPVVPVSPNFEKGIADDTLTFFSNEQALALNFV